MPRVAPNVRPYESSGCARDLHRLLGLSAGRVERVRLVCGGARRRRRAHQNLGDRARLLGLSTTGARMIALLWVVREPDGTRAIATCDGMIAAIAYARRIVAQFRGLVPVVHVEAHRFQAACDRDWKYPSYQIRIEAHHDTPGRYHAIDAP